MGIFDRLSANLSAAAEEIPGEEIDQASRDCDQLADQMTTTTHPSQNPDVLAAIGRLREAAAALRRALTQSHRAIRHLDAYARHAGVAPINRTLPPVPTEPRTRAQPGAAGPAAGKPEPARGFHRHPDHRVPDFVTAIADDLTIPPGAKVAGIATDHTGRRLHQHTLVNGSRGAATDNRRTLANPWRRLDVALSHVEGHAAALTRERRLDRMTLVITRRPCPGTLGCHAMLAHLVPKGTRVDIYVTEPGGTHYWGTYNGTGEGVTQT